MTCVQSAGSLQVGVLGDRMAPGQVRHLGPGLVLLQNPDDLFFTVTLEVARIQRYGQGELIK